MKAGDVLFRLRDREQTARLRESEAELGARAGGLRPHQTRSRSSNAAAAAQLDKARANLEVARARTELRRVELDRTRIRAPFDGRVGARLVSPGARIKVDDGLVQIDGIDPLSLVFSIPEAVLPLARVGAQYELEVAAFPDRRFPGEIRFIAPSVDSATRRITIKGRVPNADGTLLPGMFARVKAKLGERDAVLVPEEALVTTSDGTFVWRIGADDKAERVAVELGGREPGRVEIVSGVAAGDRIVTAGTHKVHAGAPVKAGRGRGARRRRRARARRRRPEATREALRDLHRAARPRDGALAADHAARRDRAVPPAQSRAARRRPADRLGDDGLPGRRARGRRDLRHRAARRPADRHRGREAPDLAVARAGVGDHRRVRARARRRSRRRRRARPRRARAQPDSRRSRRADRRQAGRRREPGAVARALGRQRPDRDLAHRRRRRAGPPREAARASRRW